MTRLALPEHWRRGLSELALLLAVGAFMGTIGPFGTGGLPAGYVYTYWIAAIVGGGVIGITIDETLGRRAGGFWPRLAVSSVLMTPAVTLLVLMLGYWMSG